MRNFEDSDILEASAVSHLTWGDLYTHESAELQKIIYEFMVEYYDLNREFSFSCIDEGFKGFILAARKRDRNNSLELLQSRLQDLNDENARRTLSELCEYLEACGKAVKAEMNDDDVMIGLFISLQRGCGRKLLEKLVGACRERGIKNIYLWTDTTCDYTYYRKNNFILVKEALNKVNGRTIGTLIYKKVL